MILYFSGTGNSEYVAKMMAEEMNDEVLNLFEKIRDHDYSEMNSQKPWIIVTPTYAWRIPRIVNDWIYKTIFKGNQDIYFVMTCGGAIGNAEHYLHKLCQQKDLQLKGCFEVIMPENYIALFNTPSIPEIDEILEKAKKRILEVVMTIQENRDIQKHSLTLKDRLNSSIINELFYPMFVHAKKFHTTDQCVACGKCVKVCPLKNIQMNQDKPIWGEHCTHCMACISYCPYEAIEYGKNSIGKVRYVCPKK